MPRKPIQSPIKPMPSTERLVWRSKYLAAMHSIIPAMPSTPEPNGLEPGNRKTGRTGSLYKTVFVWNLPAVASCPGASEWCLTHCYNADDRKDAFPVDLWKENWAWVTHKPILLKDKILQQLKDAEEPCAVRIHSSGDFFSVPYIDFWVSITSESPSTAFWAYTRSWAVTDLLPSLERLRAISNVQLLASYDDNMPPPPSGWRLSLVVDSLDAVATCIRPRSGNLLCPEQIGQLPNCSSCGFCIKQHKGSVIFYLH